MFPGFLYPYPIKKIAITPGATNQSTGAWVAETIAETDITGMVQTITLKELQRLDTGVFSAGDKKLTVDKSVGLKLGDRIKITENSTGTEVTEWEVKAKLDAPNATFGSLALDFETFLLIRREK